MVLSNHRLTTAMAHTSAATNTTHKMGPKVSPVIAANQFGISCDSFVVAVRCAVLGMQGSGKFGVAGTRYFRAPWIIVDGTKATETERVSVGGFLPLAYSSAMTHSAFA